MPASGCFIPDPTEGSELVDEYLGILLSLGVLASLPSLWVFVSQRKIQTGCRVAAWDEAITILHVAPGAASIVSLISC